MELVILIAGWYFVTPAPPAPGADLPATTPAMMSPHVIARACDAFHGWAPRSVVLGSGRIVVVLGGVRNNHNHGLPVVVYSDDGGQTWDPDTVDPIPVAKNGGVMPAGVSQVPDASNTAAPDARDSAPGIAVDPETDDVYVAFSALAQRGFDAAPDPHNSDIYVARSVDLACEMSFAGDDSVRLFQLTDDRLGLAGDDAGPDQVMPSIVVDTCGGVHLAFLDNRNDNNRGDHVILYDVYVVMITEFGTSRMTVRQTRLTSQPQTRTGLDRWLSTDAQSNFRRLRKDGTIDGDLNGDEVVDGEDEAIFAALIEGLKE